MADVADAPWPIQQRSYTAKALMMGKPILRLSPSGRLLLSIYSVPVGRASGSPDAPEENGGDKMAYQQLVELPTEEKIVIAVFPRTQRVPTADEIYGE